jgi:hypothetical protein
MADMMIHCIVVYCHFLDLHRIWYVLVLLEDVYDDLKLDFTSGGFKELATKNSIKGVNE